MPRVARSHSRSDLIVHQRNQRRDDQRRAFTRDRRKLITKRLARARRHHRKRVLSLEYATDHSFLHAAEVIETEDAFQKVVRRIHSPCIPVGLELVEALHLRRLSRVSGGLLRRLGNLFRKPLGRLPLP